MGLGGVGGGRKRTTRASVTRVSLHRPTLRPTPFSHFCKPHANLPATSQRPAGRRRYGLDCARKAAGLPVEASDIEAGRMPWLKQQRLGLEAPAAAAARPEAGPQAVRRPRIFVYDTPPAYTTRMLQYRCGGKRVWDRCEGTAVGWRPQVSPVVYGGGCVLLDRLYKDARTHSSLCGWASTLTLPCPSTSTLTGCARERAPGTPSPPLLPHVPLSKCASTHRLYKDACSWRTFFPSPSRCPVPLYS